MPTISLLEPLEPVLHAKHSRRCGLRVRSQPEHDSHEDAKKSPKLPIQVLFDDAPRIRVRNLSDRQMEQLGELVVANERLAGRPGPKARQRVEFLKRRREVWEQIYYHLTKEEATATLLTLEEAHKQVAEAMSGQWREKQSVSALKKQLVVLQSKVSEAHGRLHYTQDLVQLNMNRIQQQAGQEATHRASDADPASLATPAAEARLEVGEASQAVVDSTVVPTQEPDAASRWVPVAFSEAVKEGMSVFQHAGQPWVLFRDAQGNAACIEDCCAHRACPLSLGKVVKGQPTCAYHGWKYNSKGECTEMPSTMMCPGIRVNHMACAEADGVVWVARAGADPPLRLPKNPAAALDGMTVVSRVQMDMKVDSGVMERHLLQQGPIISSWDPQPRKVSGSWAQAGVATLLNLGGEGSAEVTQPGWITCSQGESIREVHTLTQSKPGECRWLYQLSIPSHHWSRGAIPKHFWHQLAEKAMATQRANMEAAEGAGTGSKAA